MNKQQKFEKMIDALRELGCNANIAAFLLPDTKSGEEGDLFVWFPTDGKDTLEDISSKLANIFSEVLASTEKQDKNTFEVVRNAMVSAILPYINGLDEGELVALGLLKHW